LAAPAQAPGRGNGVISFSESEARLNIQHVLKNTSGAVQLTDGIADLRNLMKDQTLYRSYPTRIFFALFDFDEAYGDWDQLDDDVGTGQCKCLIKKQRNRESYALFASRACQRSDFSPSNQS
jgi:hypothetical protein